MAKRGYSSISTYVAKRSRANPALKRRRVATVKTVTVVPGITRRTGFYGRDRGNGELKFLDQQIAVAATTSLVALPDLCTIAVGDREFQRDGRKCVIKSIQFDGEVTATYPVAAAGEGRFYMTWVIDTQTNGVAAAATDVWTTPAGATQQLNLANTGRFRILAKKEFDLNAMAPVAAGGFGSVIKSVHWRKSLNLPMEYDNTTFTTGVISTIKTNNILCFISMDANQLGAVALRGTSRLRFVG